jgi:hypothetical protein
MLFWIVQNSVQPVGGAMAFQKALWLADAVVLWMVLPIFIARDSRIGIQTRHAFRALLILMALRAVIELWMLYVTLNWSPWYGIAHDVLCMVVLLGYLVRWAPAIAPLWRAHLAATALAFVPEIYFAWYMQHHFNTQGSAAVYFVPDEPAHAFALNLTWVAVVCFTPYIFLFLFRWSHAASVGGSKGEQ